MSHPHGNEKNDDAGTRIGPKLNKTKKATKQNKNAKKQKT